MLNPQLIIYSTALGGKILAVRIFGWRCRMTVICKKEKPREFEIANSISLNDNFKEEPLGGSKRQGDRSLVFSGNCVERDIPALFSEIFDEMRFWRKQDLGALKIALGAKHFA